MTHTDSGFEYVDFSFQPRLSSLVRGDYLTFAINQGFADVALPAPSLDRDRKLALWNATVPNHLGEIGVLAVSARNFGNIITTQRQWFCGMVPGDVYEEAVLVQDEKASEQVALGMQQETTVHKHLIDLELAAVLVEFANFGPYTLFKRADIPGALDLLQTLYRK